MEALRIFGGQPLHGVAIAARSKNAILPIMAASLLCDETVKLPSAPLVSDVEILADVLRELDVDVERGEAATLRLDASRATSDANRASRRPFERIRASICVLGPLLARRGKAIVPLPGGCCIGQRPIDLHLKGLAALGADFCVDHGYVVGRAKRLRGAAFDLRGPRGSTVTGTANVLCAATLAKGLTVINGAAREPEIVDLGNFLIKCGANISGIGDSRVEIRGVDQLGGCVHRVIPDRIEVATLAIAAAITGGAITIEGVACEHLTSVLDLLTAIGVSCRTFEHNASHSLYISATNQLKAFQVSASPYPGLPTDVQPLLTCLASQALGKSTIRDTVFPHRLWNSTRLQLLGATLRVGLDRQKILQAEILGPTSLSGGNVHAADLRSAAGLVLAGLAARGQTLVQGVYHLDRGYDQLDNKLAGLGARIERIAFSRKDSNPTRRHDVPAAAS